MPVHRRALGDLSDVPITPIQEADIEQESATPSSSLSKPLLDREARLDLRDELPAHNGPREAQDGLDASQEEKKRFITTILINLSAIMERTDEQLLPAVYRFVGASFQVCCSARALQRTGFHYGGLDLGGRVCPPHMGGRVPIRVFDEHATLLMQASPSELGLLTLSRAVVQALVSPVGGFLGETRSLLSLRKLRLWQHISPHLSL